MARVANQRWEVFTNQVVAVSLLAQPPRGVERNASSAPRSTLVMTFSLQNKTASRVTCRSCEATPPREVERDYFAADNFA